MSAETIPQALPTVPEQAIAPDQDSGVRLRRWTRAEYHQAAALGWFDNERVELIRGEVYHNVTQKPPHFSAIYAAAKVMEEVFGSGFCVRQQGPLPLLDDNEPEPDILVAAGSWRDYTTRHPSAAEVVLLIEVADTTLHMDRGKKRALYAEGGIQDYWILDINERALTVCRDPASLSDASGGFGYRSVTNYAETESVAPLAAPQASLRVADLLPPPAAAPAAE